VEVAGGRRAVLPSNEQTGWGATIGKGDIKHITAFAKSEADFLAIGAAPDLWRTARYVKTEDWKAPWIGQKAGKEQRLLGTHYFANEIHINGQTYEVKIFGRETKDGKNYYHQQLSRKKEPGRVHGGGAPD